MPKRIKPLTDTKVRTAKHQEKEYKLFDGGGMFLMVYTFRNLALLLGPFLTGIVVTMPVSHHPVQDKYSQ